MNGIVDRIQEDQKTALKARERERVSALRLLSSELTNKRIELGRDLTDDDAIDVLTRALKQRRDLQELVLFALSDDYFALRARLYGSP